MNSPASASTAARPAAATKPAGELRLSIEQASYSYSPGERQAPTFTLEATSFQARQRELIAILGPNASGKSTLLRLLSGTFKPLSGRVQLDGFEISALAPRLRAQRIAMVQQESPLLFPMRVWEYVMQGRHPYGRALRFETEGDFQIVQQALTLVVASHLRDRWMHQISGGEKQRVVLARALAQQPLLLLLDEPTLHLDIGAQVDLLRRLRRLAHDGNYTVVVVTHELNLAAEFADQVVVMHRGKALRVGPPADVYRRELLEQVFDAELEVETGAGGLPRVTPRGRDRSSKPESGGSASQD